MDKIARPTGFKVYNGQYSTFVEYEYRGHKYEVEYTNDMSYYVTAPSTQHRIAQEQIDEEIEKEKLQKKPYRYEDTAEYGFELFWEDVNS